MQPPTVMTSVKLRKEAGNCSRSSKADSKQTLQNRVLQQTLTQKRVSAGTIDYAFEAVNKTSGDNKKAVTFSITLGSGASDHFVGTDSTTVVGNVQQYIHT